MLQQQQHQHRWTPAVNPLRGSMWRWGLCYQVPPATAWVDLTLRYPDLLWAWAKLERFGWLLWALKKLENWAGYHRIWSSPGHQDLWSSLKFPSRCVLWESLEISSSTSGGFKKPGSKRWHQWPTNGWLILWSETNQLWEPSGAKGQVLPVGWEHQISWVSNPLLGVHVWVLQRTSCLRFFGPQGLTVVSHWVRWGGFWSIPILPSMKFEWIWLVVSTVFRQTLARSSKSTSQVPESSIHPIQLL